MITVKARINITQSSNGNIINAEITANGNNISAVGNSIIKKTGSSLGKPFILGRSILGKGDTYVKQLPYYMSRYLSDENGKFNETHTINIFGKNLSAIILVFDKENNRHPNTIEVNGQTLTDDDPQFEIPLDSSTNSHIIYIPNWNAPNEPLIITGIYADIDIDIDEKNLVSFNSNIMDRETEKYPSYGIISNGANLNFSDFDEKTLDLIKQKILHSGITVTAWIENKEAKQLISEMEIRELTYDNNNRQVQLTLKDNLEDWQNINVPAINYDPRPENNEPKTAQWYYEYLYNITRYSSDIIKYDMLSFDELDNTTKHVLSTTVIQYPLLESGNLWDSWNKLCEVCLLHIYVNNENRIVVKYSV